MHSKRSAPITVFILIMIFGIAGLYSIYNHFDNQEISVSNSAIDQVNTETSGLDLKTIIHKTEKNVMLIEGQNEDETITGSGFLYNEKGDIITNAHVVENADIIYVRTANARIYPAAIVGMGEETDVAVIRVPQLAGKTYLPVDEETRAEIGDEVIALGSPHGFQNTVTLGIISGSERNFSVDGFDYKNVYQISAQITHGNSGGPLINRETGHVVGINSVGTGDGTIGFSIPISEVITQVKQWSNEAQNDQLEFASAEDIGVKVDPNQFEQDVSYLIDYFFENLMIRDYVGAYTLLGSNLQSEMSYSDFREEYIHTVDLDYSDLSSDTVDENHIKTTTDVTIESKIPDEEDTDSSIYEYIFTVGYENDQLRIMDITKSK